jgi:hypothetical protein
MAHCLCALEAVGWRGHVRVEGWAVLGPEGVPDEISWSSGLVVKNAGRGMTSREFCPALFTMAAELGTPNRDATIEADR